MPASSPAYLTSKNAGLEAGATAPSPDFMLIGGRSPDRDAPTGNGTRGYAAVQPPSMVMTEPVAKAASAEQR